MITKDGKPYLHKVPAPAPRSGVCDGRGIPLEVGQAVRLDLQRPFIIGKVRSVSQGGVSILVEGGAGLTPAEVIIEVDTFTIRSAPSGVIGDCLVLSPKGAKAKEAEAEAPSEATQ